MTAKMWLTISVAAATLGGMRPSHAADWFALLDWACEPNQDKSRKVKQMVLSACSASEGTKAACDVAAGTPFACFTSSVVARDKTACDTATLTFQIETSTSETLGWKVVGTLTVSASYSLLWDTAQDCELAAKSPVPTAQGGTYVSRAGTAKAVATFVASGTGKVKFLGGTVFSEAVNKRCTRQLSVQAYDNASAGGCQGPSPTPSPSSPPTPSPSASPSP